MAPYESGAADPSALETDGWALNYGPLTMAAGSCGWADGRELFNHWPSVYGCYWPMVMAHLCKPIRWCRRDLFSVREKWCPFGLMVCLPPMESGAIMESGAETKGHAITISPNFRWLIPQISRKFHAIKSMPLTIPFHR